MTYENYISPIIIDCGSTFFESKFGILQDCSERLRADSRAEAVERTSCEEYLIVI